jgi:hypothetical protein
VSGEKAIINTEVSVKPGGNCGYYTLPANFHVYPDSFFTDLNRLGCANRDTGNSGLIALIKLIISLEEAQNFH